MADPFLDALGVADPADKPAKTTPAAASDPFDDAVRTVYAEASKDPTERQWIAGVIANRAKAKKVGLGDVVKEPGQFEPWMTAEGRAKMAALDPNSDEYKEIAAQVGPILKGEADPSGGATHFYAPGAQTALGRPKPDFDDGTGKQVGQTMFFGGKADAPDAFLGALGIDPAKAEAASSDRVTEADMAPRIPVGKLTPAQQKIYTTFSKGGYLKEDAADGTQQSPFWETPEHPAKDAPPGSYYVDTKGALKRAPGGEHESSALAGVGQGVADVGVSLSHLLPGSDDSEIKNRLIADQAAYGAEYGGDAKSGAGRFTGQVIAGLPFMAGGEAVAGGALAKAGAPQIAEFLAGRGGMAMSPGLKRILLRGASLSTSGAVAGGSQAGLTSSANEGSVPDQIVEGAVGGGLAGPAAPLAAKAGSVVGNGVKSLVEPLLPQGPVNIANRIVDRFAKGPVGAVNADEIIPGSIPTLATATADPGLATLERTMRLGEHGDKFAARDAQNSQARVDLFEKLRGDEHSIAALEDARESATSGAREAALKAQTKPADINPVLDTIDTILKGPEGKRSEVVKALTAVRDNLHDAAGNPETSAEILYGVRKEINDLLSPKASSDKRGAQLAASQLMDVKKSLDDVIQGVAPGFKEYLKNYSDLSKPIDEQNLLQSLKITDMRGNITLARAQSALDKLKALRAKGGANAGKSVTSDTIDALTSIRDDLKRGDNINLARPIGPDTAQHFTTGGRLQQAGVPGAVGLAIAHHPIGAAAIGGARLLYGLKDKEITAHVANRLLNPAASTVSPVVAKAKSGLAKRLQRGAGMALPAAAGMISNRLVAGQ